jgi:hypothetical protein
MEKVYTIETTGRADFCIGAFADLEKAKQYYEIAKTRVGREETPTIELKLAKGLQLVEWQGEEWKIIDEWQRVEED